MTDLAPAEALEALNLAVQTFVDALNRDEGEPAGTVTGWVMALEESAITEDGYAVYGNRYTTGEGTTRNTAVGLFEWGSHTMFTEAFSDD